MKRRQRRVRGMLGTIAALVAATTLGCVREPEASRFGNRPELPPPAAWDDARREAAADLAAALAALPAAGAGELVVRLAFAADADLDLYVSDPLDETVYYANTPARSGGALDADRRCADAAPRVETIRFARPLAGRYRVGVDFQERCARGVDVAPWAITIDAQDQRRTLTGLAEWNVFASRVDEFVIE